MNIRIHSFKVYRLQSKNTGGKIWTFHPLKDKMYPDARGDHDGWRLLETTTFWALHYRFSEKDGMGKSLVKKVDLQYLLVELAQTGGLEKILEANQ